MNREQAFNELEKMKQFERLNEFLHDNIHNVCISQNFSIGYEAGYEAGISIRFTNDGVDDIFNIIKLFLEEEWRNKTYEPV